MDRKKLNWNKNNIEIAQKETERLIARTAIDDEKRMLYGIIRAILWALGFILDEMHRLESAKRRAEGEER